MDFPHRKLYAEMINAFKVDCETLVGKFNKSDTKTFKQFCSIWKSLRFNLIYEKYSKQGLHHDFKEDSLQIAKSIMLNDCFVSGLFLMFGMYTVMEDPMIKIRLEHMEFQKIQNSLKELKYSKEEKIVLCILFGKLMKSEAFYFVMFSREYSVEGNDRGQLIHGVNSFPDDSLVKPKQWLKNFMENIDCLDEIKDIEHKYFQTKKRIKEDYQDLHLSLNMVEEDIFTTLLKGLTQADSMVDPMEIDDIGTIRRKLKNRKMNIRRRYCRPDEMQSSVEVKPVNRAQRVPRGMNKLYLNSVLNNPDYDSDSFDDEEEEEVAPRKIKLCLPEIS